MGSPSETIIINVKDNPYLPILKEQNVRFGVMKSKYEKGKQFAYYNSNYGFIFNQEILKEVQEGELQLPQLLNIIGHEVTHCYQYIMQNNSKFSSFNDSETNKKIIKDLNNTIIYTPDRVSNIFLMLSKISSNPYFQQKQELSKDAKKQFIENFMYSFYYSAAHEVQARELGTKYSRTMLENILKSEGVDQRTKDIIFTKLLPQVEEININDFFQSLNRKEYQHFIKELAKESPETFKKIILGLNFVQESAEKLIYINKYRERKQYDQQGHEHSSETDYTRLETGIFIKIKELEDVLNFAFETYLEDKSISQKQKILEFMVNEKASALPGIVINSILSDASVSEKQKDDIKRSYTEIILSDKNYSSELLKEIDWDNFTFQEKNKIYMGLSKQNKWNLLPPIFRECVVEGATEDEVAAGKEIILNVVQDFLNKYKKNKLSYSNLSDLNSFFKMQGAMVDLISKNHQKFSEQLNDIKNIINKICSTLNAEILKILTGSDFNVDLAEEYLQTYGPNFVEYNGVNESKLKKHLEWKAEQDELEK